MVREDRQLHHPRTKIAMDQCNKIDESLLWRRWIGRRPAEDSFHQLPFAPSAEHPEQKGSENDSHFLSSDSSRAEDRNFFDSLWPPDRVIEREPATERDSNHRRAADGEAIQDIIEPDCVGIRGEQWPRRCAEPRLA